MSILLHRGEFGERFPNLSKQTKENQEETTDGGTSSALTSLSGAKLPYLFDAQVFPATGVLHSKDAPQQLKERWLGTESVFCLPHFMIFFTVAYLLTFLYSNIDSNSRGLNLYIVCVVILAILPCIKLNRTKYIAEGITAILLSICILELEYVLGRRQGMVTLMTFLIVGRVLLYKSFFDNFALCISYTASVAALNASAASWYFASNAFVWTYFLIAMLLLYVYKRLWHRIWEHVRILLILTEKLKREDHIGRAIIAAHIPRDIQAHIFPTQADVSVENTLRSGKCFLQNSDISHQTSAESSPLKTQAVSKPAGATTETLRAAAVEAGLLTDFSDAQLTLAQLQSLGGLDRRDCALITIGFDGGVGEEAVHGTRQQQCMHRMLDKLAAEHRITCVRKFGNVWIGCVGFFKTWESQYINCYEAVLFASEASFLGNSANMTFAVDCGTVTGGFLRSLNFDFFGQEIRWLLMALELKLYGKVIVGDAVQKLLNVHQKNFPDLINFKTLLNKSIKLPWRVGSEISVSTVENAVDIVDFDGLTRFAQGTVSDRKDGQTPSVSGSARKSGDKNGPQLLDWRILLDLLSQEDVYGREYGGSGWSTGARRAAMDQWAVADGEVSLDQEIGEEFLLTATQRFRLSFDDPVLDGYTDQQLHDAHVRLETQLYAVIRKVCFPSLLQFLSLRSSFVDAAGHNEYKSPMVHQDGLMIDWSHGPVAIFLGSIIGKRAMVWLKDTLQPAPAPKAETMLDALCAEKPRTLSEKRVKPVPNASAKDKYLVNSIVPIAEALEEEDDEPVNGADGADAGKRELTNLRALPVPLSGTETASIEESAKLSPKMSMHPVISRSSSASAEAKEAQRSFQKYMGDAFLFFYDVRMNGAVTALFFLATIYAADPVVHDRGGSTNISIFFSSLVALLWALLFLERRYDSIVSVMTFFLTGIAMWTIVREFACHRMSFNGGDSGLPVIGDFGGELALCFLQVVLIPCHMRQRAVLSFVDSVVLTSVAIALKQTAATDCAKPVRYRAMALYLILLFNLYYWALQYLALASYLLEHKLLPAAVRNYRKQKDNTRALLQAFAPHVPVSSSCELYVQKPFREAAVAALHVKVADQIAHFMDPRELSLILTRVHKIVEKSVVECGMLSVTHFSGVYLAVACRDSTWDNVESLRFPDSHTARAVVFLRNVRGRLSALSRELKFNIHMGIGIDQGAVQLGFLGQERFNFDVSGPVRDLAVTMASFHSDGVFASEAFEPDIRKMQAPEDLVRDVSSVLDDKLRRETRWLRIDGSFNGIQLEDFKYLCLLGQGGYGSVHLLAEKHTGVPYAIKAIELKQESKLSKMIERECSILQMVQHPNVVNLKYSFRNHNRLYLVMSYIRGGNLKQVVERDKLGLAHMLMWFAELVLAIEYLHSLGIIHRDIKPANCMIGTDGHMKLGDFGLSKVVGMQQAILDGKAAVLREEALGLQSDSIEKVRKFLPLKLDAAQREEQQAEATAHRTVKVLLITMDDSKADSTLLFINTTVEVSIADYDIDSDTIKLSQFEAIFIDGDYYEEDSPELVAHFCSHLFNGLPVLLCAKSEELRKRGLASGARACSRLPLEALTEDTFDSIFGSEQQVPAVDPLRDHLCDIAVLQEERLKLQLVQDSLHPSLDDKGFNRENSNTRAGADRRNDGSRNSFQQRNSVAVESRSHSLVGTLHFIAPEVIRLRRYGKAVDWWACGITIYECLVRKHVFGGEEKAQVFENIMNAPIVLDELAPFGEPVTALVRGLLNRDIKRRLGSGSQGAQAIKSHKLFEKIDWATVSTSNPVHKPAQFVNKKFRVDDRDLFYGPRGDHDASLRPEQLAERNSSSMAKYISNKKRARMSANNSKQSGSLKIGKLSGSHKNSGSGKLNDVAIRQRQRSGSGSRSFHKSQGSGSLEFVPEAPHEAHEEEDVRN